MTSTPSNYPPGVSGNEPEIIGYPEVDDPPQKRDLDWSDYEADGRRMRDEYLLAHQDDDTDRIDALVEKAQADLRDAITDTLADWGEDPPVDDIAHDLAQSIASMMDDPTALREFLRREGVAMPSWISAGDDTLGSCGCVDYHMADCPLRTGGSDMTADDYLAVYSSPGYDPYYDESDR